jgi:predicted ABC-type ATPase
MFLVQQPVHTTPCSITMEKPFAVETVFSTKLLDPSIKMDVSNVKK